MALATLIRFSRLVSDSQTSEGVYSLLGQAVVEKCGMLQAIIFETSESGSFRLLSQSGDNPGDFSNLNFEGIGSLSELRNALLSAFDSKGFNIRPFPLISESSLFGALFVSYSESTPPSEEQWSLVEALTELTAISLSKTYRHLRLQKAYDDLKASQDALVRTEKSRALGQMSSGIAHDLRNLLNPLVLYADEICDVADDRNAVLEIAHRMDRILNRGLETVERLRDFSRQSPAETDAVPTNLNFMAREAIEICKPRLGTIQLQCELGNVPSVLIRPSDCITAVVNLIFNAIDALEGKGIIRVRTGATEGDAWLEVVDNGPGIPQEIKSRILEPFFTTKGTLGTGLGVSTVYAFTQRHEGRLQIDSEIGKGTSFRISFPQLVPNHEDGVKVPPKSAV